MFVKVILSMTVTDRLNASEMYILLALKTLQFCGITHYAYLQVCFKLYNTTVTTVEFDHDVDEILKCFLQRTHCECLNTFTNNYT